MEKIVLPNYENCTLNIVSSILKYYGVSSEYKTNDIVDNHLTKNYKNVVLMIFDGMGCDAIENNLPQNSFIRKKIKEKITSVFPSTTTSAITSYLSGVSPNEHAWLGWNLYFKEYAKIIEVFPNVDMVTKKIADEENHVARKIMPYQTIFEKIFSQNKEKIKLYSVIPGDISFPSLNNIVCRINELEQLTKKVEQLCKNPFDKFAYVYFPSPDKLMHEYGCYSKEVKSFFESLNENIEYLSNNIEDTLLIISADHGLIDLSETIYLNDYKDIEDCLVMPPQLEARVLSFYIKNNKKEIFKKLFNEYFEEDFLLYTKEQFFDSKFLGFGQTHPKTDDFIGDFVACAKSTKAMVYVVDYKNNKKYKARHAGLTEKEMIVPLILVDKK